jgi:L-rhamnono-1,4-lactonase
MSPGHVLAKRHGISDYLPVTSPPPSGFIYIETDRYLPSPSPDIHNADGQEEVRRKIVEWAKQPLEEIKFLRRIAEGKTEEGDGCEGDHDEKAEGQRMSPTPTYRFLEGQWEVMKGVVLYAPFHFSPAHFFLYMSIAEEVAGPRLWTRVVGFRYLLQGKGEGVVEGMLEGEKGGWWLSNLGELKTGNAGRGWCFDVGVDTHRDGMGPFEAVKGLIERTRVWEEKSESPGKPVRFVLSKCSTCVDLTM